MYYTVLNKMQGISDAQQHQILYGFFRGDDDKRPFCFRDTGDEILMLSNQKPNTDCKEIVFEKGQTLMFECRASINARKHRGVKIPARDFTAEHIKEWFKRRLDGGAYVDFVTFKRLAPHKIYKNDGSIAILDQTMFYGTLTVMNPKQFEEIISTGIGKGGVFGFGMMILPQVMK